MPTTTDPLVALEDAARAATLAARSATVSIGRDGRGSGVVIGPGAVLTNAHNLRDRTTSVTFADGRVEQGAVAGVDAAGDLAVLTVDTAETAPIEWSTEQPSEGSVVFGASAGRQGSRVSLGVVSGTGRTFRGPRGRLISESLEHTAPLARGSSGGPLVDRTGRLVGVNTHRLGEGFYLAVRADDELHRRIDALAAGESPTPLTLGIAIAPPHVARRLRASVGLDERDGLLVRSVEVDGPADRAGIRQGDLVVGAGGAPTATPDALFEALGRHDASTPLAVDLVRGAEEITVSVEFETGTQAEADTETEE
jgi:serine protease Do